MGLLLLTGASLVTRRAYELQVERGPVLKEMAEEQYLRTVQLAPKRGTIYDRHGAELAVSVDADSVWANPRELKRAGRDPREVALRLNAILSIDVERITERLRSDRYFVWVKRRVTPRQAAAVRTLSIPGVSMSDEARRYYPNRQLAAHILGFTNVDGKGIEGLEMALEDRLRGSDRTVPAIRDRRGSVVFSEQLLDDRAAQGDDVYLTIDKTIQHLVERELELAVRTFEARAGSIAVMDPENGELLAVANYPSYNPNQPGAAPAAHRRNRAATDRFEPGSTVKPFTVAGALAAGSIRSDQVFDCENGAMQVAEHTIRDSHAFDMLTPAQILAHSSNIGAAKIGATLGRRGLFRIFRRFGFGDQSGSGMPGETAGDLRHYERWYDMDAATIAFGQGMSVNNIQMVTAMAAIANGGRLMRPILVRRVADGRGELVEETLPRVRRQVVPRSVARLVADMLTAVTGPGGTAPEAAIDGYLVAGKTGTAQKADYARGGYADSQWVASFVGFVPARNPRLVISVVIDEPIIAHTGGAVAGPVFRRVGEAALRHLGVPASTGGEALARRGPRREAQPSNEDVRDSAGSDTVTGPERQLTEGEVVVPDVLGQTARAALVTLYGASLDASLTGSGLVTGQRPGAREIVPTGTQIRVYLAPPGFHEELDTSSIQSDREGALAAAAPSGGGFP